MLSKGSIKEGSDYEAARTQKMRAEARISEIELEKIERSVVLAEDVVSAWENTLGAMKARLLSIPTKAAPILASESNAGNCQGILDDMIREALEELANYDPKINPGKSSAVVESLETGDGNAATAAKPKRKPVGRPKKTARLAD